jgi:fumarate reductase flavoprotein subunit
MIRRERLAYAIHVPVLVIGGGAAGLVAALAAREGGAEVLVVERDPVPRGSTALSAGLIPAAGTRWQAQAGIADDPDAFAADIIAKAHGEPDAGAVAAVTRAIGPVIEWLADRHAMPFDLVTNFRYPGHSALRMHGVPSRSGEELVDRLREAATAAGVEILCGARAVSLFAGESGHVDGVELERPDGSRETIGCEALVLACNGFGGNRGMVERYVPELADALFFGHTGNQGDALLWGEALGAATRHLSGHQGHGSVALPHGILITWACIMEGGFQVNAEGERFADESRGYSEQAGAVMRQPGSIAWTIFDERIAGIARQFEDYRAAEAAGAVLTANGPGELARLTDLPEAALTKTFMAVELAKRAGAIDGHGRDFAGTASLRPPLHAVRVTGALFHTQGGLVVDEDARVLRPDGSALPNLFAAGGAACGVSGSRASGYLSGNGLLTAVAYGWLAGRAAAGGSANAPAGPDHGISPGG